MTTNVTSYLNKLQLDLTSPLASLQRVRSLIESAENPIGEAQEIIKNITGQNRVFDSILDARMTVLGIVERVVVANGDVEEGIVEAVEAHVKSFRDNPAMSWMYAGEIKEQVTQQTQTIAGTNIQVELNEDGKIKKGGKQMIVKELYKKLVLEAEQPLNSGEFTKEIVARLGMTIAGARTYTFNCTKEFGVPEGFAGQRGKKKVELTEAEVAEKEAQKAAEKEAKATARAIKKAESDAKKEADKAEKAALKAAKKAENDAKKVERDAIPGREG